MKTICTFLMIITITHISKAQSSLEGLTLGLNMRKAALAAGIRSDAYDKVIRYFSKYYNLIENKNYVSFIDFSLPSTQERLFIVNFRTGRVSRFLVAHGKNSGLLYAKSFSNDMNSNQSSLGLYKIQEEYSGNHGPSLKLDGLERSNSNARARSIVMHQADYVSAQFAKDNGYLGRSWGCMAMNPEDWQLVRSRIKSGSLILAYN